MKMLHSAIFIFFPLAVYGQDTVSLKLRTHINVLAADSLSGRGYVNQGMHKAASYIKVQFKSWGLEPLGAGYAQAFGYRINTFPGIVKLKMGSRVMQAGKQYLIVPSSKGTALKNKRLKIVDAVKIVSEINKHRETDPSRVWQQEVLKRLSDRKFVYYIRNSDTLLKVMNWKGSKDIGKNLPEGLFFIAKRGKPVWPASQVENKATLIEIWDSTCVMRENERVTAVIRNKWDTAYQAENLMGMVRGTEYPDSYIVFTAHYDHLGKMGNETCFPGASDNASGTAMLLALAQYYAAHPGKYNMLFIAFAGEEAGLLGSQYFTEHPLIALEKIRFLVNIDIMGDASDGLSVVNGDSYPGVVNAFKTLNAQSPFPLPDIRSGGNAHNSDHYYFTERNVPAVFIFSRGGKGWYHDIWDKPEAISLKNIPQVYELLKAWVKTL